jgi:hypothetical protein
MMAGKEVGERERETLQDIEKRRYILQGYAPVTYFLQLSLTFYSFHCLPIVHSIMNL